MLFLNLAICSKNCWITSKRQQFCCCFIVMTFARQQHFNLRFKLINSNSRSLKNLSSTIWINSFQIFLTMLFMIHRHQVINHLVIRFTGDVMILRPKTKFFHVIRKSPFSLYFHRYSVLTSILWKISSSNMVVLFTQFSSHYKYFIGRCNEVITANALAPSLLFLIETR